MSTFITESIKYLLKKTNLPVGSGISINALSDQLAADAIKEELLADKPSFIARFGWTELDSIIAYTSGIENEVQYGRMIRFLIKHFIDNPQLLKKASGFFSNDINNVRQFCRYQLDIMNDIDMYGSWTKQEKFIEKYLINAVVVTARSLFDPDVEHPWTEVLEGKRVLVIHPFANSIQHQYKKKDLLFKNRSYLSDFLLETYKPIQITNDNAHRFESWWEALDVMKKEIAIREFDIALLACGAFGHPLCGHIKKIGKKAIYMGGDLQMMFGIYGQRWAGNKLINENWIRPLQDDLPEKALSNSYQALNNYI